MKQKRTRPDPTARALFGGPFIVSIRPTKAGQWDGLTEHLEDLRKGPEREAVEALEVLEKDHGEAFYTFALEAIKGRSSPVKTKKNRQAEKALYKAMGYPRTDKERRRMERHNLARALYLFLEFMKHRWGGATGVLERYRMKRGKDTGGAGAVRRCLRAAGIPVPNGDVGDFGRKYCYGNSKPDKNLPDKILAGWAMHLSTPSTFPDLIEMVGKKHPGKVRLIIGGVNQVPKDPDALALRLVTDGEEDWSLAAVLCLCIKLPAEAREMTRTIPAIGNLPDLVEAWRARLPLR